MAFEEESLSRIEELLQTLYDEGWDSGMAYASIQYEPDSVKEQYWNDAEEKENKLMSDVLASIARELTVEIADDASTVP